MARGTRPARLRGDHFLESSASRGAGGLLRNRGGVSISETATASRPDKQKKAKSPASRGGAWASRILRNA